MAGKFGHVLRIRLKKQLSKFGMKRAFNNIVCIPQTLAQFCKSLRGVRVMVFNATFNNISVTLYIVAVIFWFVAEGITKLISTYKLSVSHLQNDILTGEKKIRTFYIIIMIRTDIRSKDNSERQDVLKGVLDYLVHLHHIAPFKRT